MKDAIASGDSMYEPIMNGSVNVNDDGEYFDAETGEMIDAAPVKKLEPKKEIHHPDTLFTAPDEPQEEFFDSVFEAKRWIGMKLKPHGLNYGDVKDFFDTRLVDLYELDKQRIAAAIQEIRQSLTQTG